jgi:hypothetical protein
VEKFAGALRLRLPTLGNIIPVIAAGTKPVRRKRRFRKNFFAISDVFDMVYSIGSSMTIRINSASGATSAGASGGVRKGSGEGFSLSGASGAGKTAGPAQASAAMGMLGVDALLALQAEDDVMTGRRKRQVKRSRDMLDALDDLRISVLSGDIDDEALLRLQGLIAQHREDVADDRLQGVLNEIETRACVELAKRRLI